jgi:hypothetical protein
MFVSTKYLFLLWEKKIRRHYFSAQLCMSTDSKVLRGNTHRQHGDFTSPCCFLYKGKKTKNKRKNTVYGKHVKL